MERNTYKSSQGKHSAEQTIRLVFKSLTSADEFVCLSLCSLLPPPPSPPRKAMGPKQARNCRRNLKWQSWAPTMKKNERQPITKNKKPTPDKQQPITTVDRNSHQWTNRHQTTNIQLPPTNTKDNLQYQTNGTQQSTTNQHPTADRRQKK
jgi:hypothetical protein